MGVTDEYEDVLQNIEAAIVMTHRMWNSQGGRQGYLQFIGNYVR